MDMAPLAVGLYLGLPLFLGAGVLRLLGIGARTDAVSYAGWAWMAGTLLTGACVGLWLCVAPASAGALVPSLGMAALGGALFALGDRRHGPPLAAEALEGRCDASEGERAFFALALMFVLAAFVERILHGSLFAVVTTDEGAFWSFRAKVLFHEGGFGQAYADGVRRTGQGNADYPLLNPLLQAWSFLSAGRITHVANRVAIQLFVVALVLVLAGALRRWVRPAVAGLLLLLLPSMDPLTFAARHAYGDVMVALGALVLLDAQLRWRVSGDRPWLGLAGLGLAFALASKNEAQLVAGAAGLALVGSWLAAPRGERACLRPRRALWVLLPAVAVHGLGWLHNRAFGFRNTFFEGARGPRQEDLGDSVLGNVASGFVEQARERLEPTLAFFGRHVFLEPRHSWFLFPAFLALVVLLLPFLRRSVLRFATLYVCAFLAGLVLVFLTLPFELEYHLRTAGGRVVMDALPVAMLWIGAAAGTFLDLGRGAGTGIRRQEPGVLVRLLRAALVLFLITSASLSTRATALRLWNEGALSLRHALTWDEEERLHNAFQLVDGRYGFAPRTCGGIYEALRTYVPPDAEVVASARDGDVRWKLVWILRSVAYPRTFTEVHPRPGELVRASDLAPLAGEAFVLDLVGVDEHLAPHFERLAGGQGWSLWR